jgi:ABC-type transport system involved in multi-copper enzyme maturation permease subunit
MGAVAAIAELTWKEAVRRRFVYAGLLICVAFLVIAFIPIHPRRAFLFPDDQVTTLIGQIIATFGGHIAEFFAFLFAITLSAGSISSELDRGVLSVILPKPISRWSVYVGKWLGVNLFVLLFLLLWVAILEFAIYNHTHVFMLSLCKAYFLMALYPLVFSAVTFFFSTFTSNILSIVLPLMLSSVAWTEGLLNRLGYQFDEGSLKFAAKVVVLAAPLSPLHRWVERVLNPALFLELQNFVRPPGPPEHAANISDLVWIFSYGIIAFIAGLIVFQRRDI